MFTPPPSPLPLPRIVVTDDSDSTTEKDSMSEGSGSQHSYSSRDEKCMQSARAAAVEVIIENHERKRRSSRRTRWAILLVPVVLVLVALSSRRASMFDAFDDADPDFSAEVGGLSSEVGADDTSLEAGLGWQDAFVDQRRGQVHHRKRQTLSLTDPAAPSSSVLVTPTSPISLSDSSLSPSQTASPTTTVPETQQTIPPVPDSSSPPALPTPFPQPFDTTGATSNVTTQTCANFFTNMTQADAFRTCRPFSLLEQSSFGFIQSQTNLSMLNALIFGTCTTTTPLSTCISNMDWFASSLSSECSTELKENNELVQQTLLGLQSYALLRDAACLTNQQSNTYCYAAAAHASSPADLYLYQLPLGIGFPTNMTQPSCSTCARSLLGLYADAVKSGNVSEGGLGDTYEDAAQQAESVCGSGYALVGIVNSGAALNARTASRGVVTLALGVAASVMLWL